MFYYISGELAFKCEGFAVIDAGGVGYKIYTSSQTLSSINGGKVKLYTYVHVREDILDIFGFATLEELTFFELLITVSGVGPKAALSILSALSPRELAIAVVTGDSKSITKAQGVGSKISQRIVIELKDKLKDKNTEDLITSCSADISRSSGSHEAVDALAALGYSSQEAARAIASLDTEGLGVEGVIKEALKVLMR
jgi:Holliday junction DNA helicase RuvA